MNTVQPIRDKQTIEKIKNILKAGLYRDYLLFVTGINTGLRISDILNLKVSDVKDKSHILIVEKKTNKPKRIVINPMLREALEIYIADKSDNTYLFESRIGNNQPLQRIRAYHIINDVCKKVGILDQTGTHTLRKTFGYHHYQQHKDIAVLQDIFNHSAPSITLRYIGLTADIVDQTIMNFGL